MADQAENLDTSTDNPKSEGSLLLDTPNVEAALGKDKAKDQPAAPPSAPVLDIKDGTKVPDWKSMLPEDIRNDPSLKTVANIEGLAKSFVHAQKMIGADKVMVPGKHATDEDFHKFYTKVGKPENIEGYTVKFNDNADPRIAGEFKKASYGLHLTDKQAQGLYDWFEQYSGQIQEAESTKIKSERQSQLQALEKKWGAGFDAKLARARLVIKHWGKDHVIEHMRKTGVSEDPVLVEFLAEIGEQFTEDQIMGHADGPIGMTPDEAKTKARSLTADMKGPYWDKAHPNHQDAVNEVESLYKYAAKSRNKR